MLCMNEVKFITTLYVECSRKLKYVKYVYMSGYPFGKTRGESVTM